MSYYLDPRRFARVWEMNRQGFPRCGTLTEQQMIRDVFTKYAPFDSKLDRILQAVDAKVNERGRSFLQIDVLHNAAYTGAFGNSTDIWIQLFLNPANPPTTEEMEIAVLHEFGHIVGKQLFNPQDSSEWWAHRFQAWVMNGIHEVEVWGRLEPIVPATVVHGG